MVKNALRIAVLLLAVGLLQSVISQAAPLLGSVDWLLIAAGLVALRVEFDAAVLTGALAGLIQDSLAGGVVGLHAFSKTLVNALLASLGMLIAVRGQLAEALVIGGATLLETIVVRALMYFLGWPGTGDLGSVTVRAVATATACGMVTVTSPWLVSTWRRWRGGRRYTLR